MISEVHNFSSFSWMISTIVSYYIFLSPGMLAISSRILPPLTTCFYVEETETGIEESLAQFCIDYSQDGYAIDEFTNVKHHGAHI